MARRKSPDPRDPVTPREWHALTAAINKLTGTVEALDKRIDGLDLNLIALTEARSKLEASVASHEIRLVEIERERADKAAVAKHAQKWRGVAFAAAGLVGGAIPTIVGYLAK